MDSCVACSVFPAGCSNKGGDEEDASGDDGSGLEASLDSDVAQEDEEESARDMGNDPDLSEDDLPVNAWGIISEV